MAKVILNIGHGSTWSKSSKKYIYDPGAVGVRGEEEHQWNKEFVNSYVVPECEKQGVKYKVIIQKKDFGQLDEEINNISESGDIVVSFHLNAADSKSANGVETLFWHSSSKSLELANVLLEANLSITKLKRRGLQPKINGNRGWTLLYYTKCPCVILESGFVTNECDMQVLNENKKELAESYVKAIKKYINK